VFANLNHAEWEVPVVTMTDSMFVLYWAPLTILPGQERFVGFGCGFRRLP
jgi:hypothetical protein